MASGIRTKITEIATGLGLACNGENLSASLFERMPDCLLKISDNDWDTITHEYNSGAFETEFNQAYANGLYFLCAHNGLRGQRPFRVEWKGPNRSIGDETVPTDLRVNWVYLISCKYASKNIHNASPNRLFRDLLGDKRTRSSNWYTEVAPKEFQALYTAVKNELGEPLPVKVDQLSADDVKIIKERLKGGWPDSLESQAAEFSSAVSQKSVKIWQSKLGSHGQRKRIVHRLIRLCPCPYFILGSQNNDYLRLRVDSPWDWDQRYSLLDFCIQVSQSFQPVVNWSFCCKDNKTGMEITTEGHVEVRWSHGKFSGNPEAKIYLDSGLRQVPGYNKI